jgi:hypothetical protein
MKRQLASYGYYVTSETAREAIYLDETVRPIERSIVIHRISNISRLLQYLHLFTRLL